MQSKAVVGIAGFVALGLSPSFLDWEQSPQKRKWFLAYYAVAIFLIYWGFFRP